MSDKGLAEQKGERLEARIPCRQKALLRRAADLKGQSLSEFVVSAATEAARQVVRELDLLELTARDQLAFAQALLEPSEATDRLKTAASEYRRGETS